MNRECDTLPYESPEVAGVEMNAEGLLCASVQYEDEYNELKFEW